MLVELGAVSGEGGLELVAPLEAQRRALLRPLGRLNESNMDTGLHRSMLMQPKAGLEAVPKHIGSSKDSVGENWPVCNATVDGRAGLRAQSARAPESNATADDHLFAAR